MTDEQFKRLPRLKPGEAMLFFSKLEETEEIITPNYRIDNNIEISISDSELKEKLRYWNDKQECLRPFPECDYNPYCKKQCDYFRKVLSKEIT